MRKLFFVLMAVMRLVNRGRGRHRRQNFLVYEAGKLLRQILRGGR